MKTKNIKRILLKISGEMLSGTQDFGLEPEALELYANKIKSPAVILYGDDEIKTGKATLKSLETGNDKSGKIEDLANEIKKLS